MVRKIVDSGNHRRFLIRCLTADIIPVSVRLKNTVRTSRSFDIIRKVERQLLNKRVRFINNSIELSSWQRDTCISQLASVLDEDTFKEWKTFLNRIRGSRHKCIIERKVATFNRLWLKISGGHSKDSRGSGKDGRYMYNNSNGHSNHTPYTI